MSLVQGSSVKNITTSHIGVIGYRCGNGGSVIGAEEGPLALRSRGLRERLEKLRLSVTDFGDSTEGEPRSPLDAGERGIKNGSLVYGHCRSVYSLVEKAIKAETMPLILGGDHSLSIGSIAAFRDTVGEPVGVLWVDTHPDINTPATSPSQRIHGMSVAVLLGLVPGHFAQLQRTRPALKPDQIVYIGLRDVDPGEKQAIKELGIRTYTMKEVDIYGLGRVVEEALAFLQKTTSGVVVSFDLDVCDPPLVPGTGTPIRGGITFREAHLLMELVADSKRLLGLELVELNPRLDRENATTDLALALIESALGKSIL